MKKFIFITFTGAFGRPRMISEKKLNKYKDNYLGEVLLGRVTNKDGELIGEKTTLPKYRWNLFLLLQSKLCSTSKNDK